VIDRQLISDIIITYEGVNMSNREIDDFIVMNGEKFILVKDAIKFFKTSYPVLKKLESSGTLKIRSLSPRKRFVSLDDLQKFFA
jgi:hypothetical protein